jgi:hypothetical protein
LHSNSVNFCVDSLQSSSVFTAGRKVFFDLFIPAELVLTGYVGREVREFIAAELVHCLLDFGEAHAVKVSLCDTNRQATDSAASYFRKRRSVLAVGASLRSGDGHDTRVIYCGDNLDQLRKLPEGCVDLIYIDPPFDSNRNYEVFWGETKEKRSFQDRHESSKAYIDYMRPRYVEPSDGRQGSRTHPFCDPTAPHRAITACSSSLTPL